MVLISERHVQGAFVVIPQDSRKNALRAGTLAAIIIEKSWCQNINSTSQNKKFQIHISMVQ